MKHISISFQIIFAGLVLFSSSLKAQWAQVSGSYGGEIRRVAARDSLLLTGTVSGVSFSTNNAKSWTAAKVGLTAPVRALAIRPNQSGSSSLFVGTQGDGGFLSTTPKFPAGFGGGRYPK